MICKLLHQSWIPTKTSPKERQAPLYPSGSQTSPRSVLLQATPLPKPQIVFTAAPVERWCALSNEMNIRTKTKRRASLNLNGMICIYIPSDIFNHRRIFCLHPSPSPLEFSAFVDWDLFENLVTWNKKNKALLQSKCITCFRYHSLQSQWPGKLPIFRCTASSSNINLHVPRASWGDEIHIYRHTERSNFLRYCSQKEATRERAKSQVAVSCSLGCPKGCMF